MSRVLPMSFNLEMVRVILDERKTVTRRRIKPKQLIGLGCDRCPNNMPEEYFEVVYEFTSFRLKNNYSLHIFPDVEEIKVIGNIFDNPELLEVEECVTQEVKQE